MNKIVSVLSCVCICFGSDFASAMELESLRLNKEKYADDSRDGLSNLPTNDRLRIVDKFAKTDVENRGIGTTPPTDIRDIPESFEPLQLAQENGKEPSSTGESADGQPTLAELSKKMNNPVSDLWMLFFQHDSTLWNGDIRSADTPQHNFKFQPVMAMPFSEKYRLILRPVFSINSFDTPSVSGGGLDFDRHEGLGDTVLLAMLSPKNLEMPWVLGAGLTSLIPTGGSDLGAENWGLGPAATVFYIGDTWTLGAVAQQFWSLDSEDDRDDVNFMDFQYILRYRLSPTLQVGFSPNIKVDWKADSDNRYTVPIGFGFDKMSMMGKVPLRWGAEVQYYVETPDTFGPEWGLRLFFIPIIPNPFADRM